MHNETLSNRLSKRVAVEGYGDDQRITECPAWFRCYQTWELPASDCSELVEMFKAMEKIKEEFRAELRAEGRI